MSRRGLTMLAADERLAEARCARDDVTAHSRSWRWADDDLHLLNKIGSTRMDSPSLDLRVDRDTLRENDPAALAWAVIAPAYAAASFYDGRDVLAESMRPLTPGQRALLALHWCVAEVANGGFDQFFTNPTGLLAPEAIDGFRRIGAPEAADLLIQARQVFMERPLPADVDEPAYDEYEGTIAFDAYQRRQRPLEHRFYTLVDGELYPKAAVYVREHAEEFVR
jgi:hypothetical protein